MPLYPLAIFEFPMVSMSQSRTTSSTKPEAVASVIQICMGNIPFISHVALNGESPTETIYGKEWAGLWSSNPSLAIFIITSHKAAVYQMSNTAIHFPVH